GDGLARVVVASAGRQVEVLNTELVAPLAGHLGSGGVVLVPTLALSTLPWGLLPELRGRPVTVAPSASAWLAARQARRPRPATRPGAGPPAVAPRPVARP